MTLLLVILIALVTLGAAPAPEMPDLRLVVAHREVQLCRNDRDAKDNAIARMQLQLDLMGERLRAIEAKTETK